MDEMETTLRELIRQANELKKNEKRVIRELGFELQERAAQLAGTYVSILGKTDFANYEKARILFGEIVGASCL